MKKILFSLLICLFANLTISAQIQRTFFGLTLGVSTKNDVIRYFRENGLAYKREGDAYLVQKKEWGGHTWSLVSLHFFDNKFYSVHFFDGEMNTAKATLETLWDKYSNSLYSKYSQYYVNEQSQSNLSVYSDKATTMSARFEKNSEGYVVLSIMYADINLLLKKRDKENSDL